MCGWRKRQWTVARVGLLGLLGLGVAAAAADEPAPAKLQFQLQPAKQPVAPGGNPALGNTPEELPAGAVTRFGSLRFSHPGGISSLVFARDGKQLITAGYDSTIRFWDIKTGKELKVLGKPQAVNPQLQQPTQAVAIQLSAKGKHLVSTTANPQSDVKLWDLEKGEEIASFNTQQPGYYISGFAVNPDGTQVATTDNTGKIKLWDAVTKKEIKSLPGHEGGTWSIAWSDDGKSLITGGSDLTVKIWSDLDNDEPTSVELGSHRDFVRSVAISADGKRVVSSGQDGMVRVWDVADKKQLHKFELPRYYNQRPQFSAVTISADGKIVTGNANLAGFMVWDAEEGKTLVTCPVDPTHLQYQQYSAGLGAVSPDGTLAAIAGGLGRIQFFDVKTGKRIASSNGHSGYVTTAVVSPDGKQVATGGSDATIRLWNLADGKQTHVLDAHVGAIGYLQFSPDGKRLYSASIDYNDKAISVWDVESGREVKTIPGNAGYTGFGSNVAVSPDGKYIASLNQNLMVTIRDVETKKVVSSTQTQSVFMAFIDEGKRLLVCGYDIRGGQPGMTFSTISVPGGEVKALPNAKIGQGLVYGVSRDGRFAITAEYNTGVTKVVDLVTGRDVRQLGDRNPNALIRQPLSRVGGGNTFVFSSDNRAFAGPGPDNNSVCVWELATGKERLRFTGHQAAVISLCFAPDGNKLVTASQDNTVLLWDLAYAGKEKPEAMKPDDLWAALASDDAGKAYRAMLQLLGAGKSAAELIGERLKPTVNVDGKVIEQYVLDLDSEDFPVRKKAMTELEKLGDIAEPYLKKVLEEKPTLEVKQRVEELLNKIQASVLTSEQLRGVRCIEVLEKLGSKETREVLEKLAKGEPGDRLTKWAKESLDRLAALSKKS